MAMSRWSSVRKADVNSGDIKLAVYCGLQDGAGASARSQVQYLTRFVNGADRDRTGEPLLAKPLTHGSDTPAR
jgi:hypothetical protein